ncbi:hypothetical protein FNV43_RR08837 [Rhamnella rubrinervis]|uniref:Leucine-rich repeat-containing N-terminal plant-type domain-containing protein n=1 Tax=Rhamnella rubrinervis TaxID=2594499 RepID=A0A8K0H8X7_9ROSA|nr:hypothetical protein FNV43_RR08837 [Rhamnella rubrinervis]
MINMIVYLRPFAILFFAIFLTIHVSFGNNKSGILCSESEKQALLSFKQDLVDPLNALVSWVVEEDCCNWAGIQCHNLTGYVEKINLAREGGSGWSVLKGEVNPSLLNLKHLTHLDLSYNDFGGIKIPSFIGSFANLRYLNLTDAGFAGLIPQQLGNLSSLRDLVLGGPNYSSLKNGFYLHVENLHWLSGLSSLEYLDMSNVNLSKASNHWSLVVNMIQNLSELRLSYCQLGYISSLTYANLTSISVLDIHGNNFYSSIPKWFFNLSTLVHLDMSDCEFRGPIPDGTWSLNSLTSLSFSGNQLNYSIPNWLFGLNSLVSLYLSVNALHGPIPCSFQNMTTLKHLYLSENHFGNLTSIVDLRWDSNSLEGQLPKSMGNLCNLKKITLFENKLSGKISEAFKRLSGCLSNSLVSLSLDRNLFSGQITDEFAEFQKLEELDISRNQLNGSFPENLGCLPNLKVLDVSSNFMKGVVSEVHFANMTNLESLLASENSLILRVTSPDWIPQFLRLGQIKLGSWSLGPQFPIWLKSLTHLWDIDLSNTGISDTIPSWFWNLSSSGFLSLNLSHNQIHGQLPDLLHVGFSTTIYLSSNKFTGPLPRISWKVAELDLSNNSFSGDIAHLICHPTPTTFSGEPNSLTILHLGDNHLSGKIPDCWRKWPLLEVINLDNNCYNKKIANPSVGCLK